MLKLLLNLAILLIAINVSSQDTTYTKQILKVYEVDRDDDAIYLDFKTTEHYISQLPLP